MSRTRRPSEALIEGNRADSVPGGVDGLVALELAVHETLSEQERELYRLAVIEGRSWEEVGRLTQLSAGAAKTRWWRARRRLAVIERGSEERVLQAVMARVRILPVPRRSRRPVLIAFLGFYGLAVVAMAWYQEWVWASWQWLIGTLWVQAVEFVLFHPGIIGAIAAMGLLGLVLVRHGAGTKGRMI